MNWTRFALGVGALVAVSVAGYFLIPPRLVPHWTGYQRENGVTQLNETDPAQDAVITIGDPLLYARETLINDRRDEYEFLDGLLRQSKDSSAVKFTPQLVRDAKILSAISSELSARISAGGSKEQTSSRDPVATKESAADSADASDNARTRRTAPSTKPAETEARRLSTAGTEGSPDKPATAPGPSVQASPQEEFRDRQAYRAELRAALAAVNLDDLHDLAGNALFRLQFKATIFPGKIKNKFGIARLTLVPPELSAGLLAATYRVWLGHTSSRLNYFDAQGRLVTDTQYENSGIFPLFTQVVRIGVSKVPNQDRKDECLELSPSDIQAGPRIISESGCYLLTLAVAPGAPLHVTRLFGGLDEKLLTAARVLRALAATGQDMKSWCTDRLQAEQISNLLPAVASVLTAAPSVAAALDGLVVRGGGLDQARTADIQSEDPLDTRLQYQRLGAAAAALRRYVQALEEAAEFTLDRIDKAQIDCPDPMWTGAAAWASKLRENASRPPLSFQGALSRNGRAAGQAYAFGTTPVELAQRLSSTASAAASLELALALSAKMASVGEAGVGSASSYARSAAHTAAALERLPLVVGFSDRRQSLRPQAGSGAMAPSNPGQLAQTASNAVASDAARTTAQTTGPAQGIISPGLAAATEQAQSPPQFGWVFGPRMRYDSDKQQFIFEQGLASYDVAAEISVPSWWPRIDMDLETVWVANWHDTAEVLKETAREPRRISIPLPVNRADLDNLTKFLVRHSVRRAQEITRIHFVEPSVLSACADEVTFLIYGTNVWRSAEVFLGGIAGTEIKVLPDMEGISAKFDLSKLYKYRNERSNPLGYEEVVLRINTRNGKDWRPIRIFGERPATTGAAGDGKPQHDCASPYSVPTPILRHQSAPAPTIFALAPTRVEACSGEVKLMLSGHQLMTPKEDSSIERKLEMPQVFLDGTAGKVEAISPDDGTNSLQILSVSFPRQHATMPSQGVMQFIMLNRSGFATAAIAADPCRSRPADIATAAVEAKPQPIAKPRVRRVRQTGGRRR